MNGKENKKILNEDTLSILDKIDTACSNLCCTLKRKNADYGNSALTAPPLVKSMSAIDGIMVRLGDKFSRLRNLYGSNSMRVNESLKDTILDIAGYCILATIAMEENNE